MHVLSCFVNLREDKNMFVCILIYSVLSCNVCILKIPCAHMTLDPHENLEISLSSSHAVMCGNVWYSVECPCHLYINKRHLNKKG